MTDQTRALLMQIAGFLKMISDGYVSAPTHTVQEAKQILEKIGVLLNKVK